MADHAHDMGLKTFFINGIAHGLAVDGQTLILFAIGLVPALKGFIQMHRVDANKDIANDREAGDDIAPVFATAIETLSGLLAKIIRPIPDGQISPHSAQDCPDGNRQNRWKGMSPSLAAAGIGDVSKEIRQGSHLLGFQHYPGASFAIKWVENRLGQEGLSFDLQGFKKNHFG